MAVDVGEAQDEAKQAYITQTHSEYLDSEISNWHDNGDALDDAKSKVAYDFTNAFAKDKNIEWAEEALQEFIEARAENDKPVPYAVSDLISAISLEYENGNSGNGKFTVEFNDDMLMHPTTLIEGQGTLPGIEEIVASSALSVEMRDEIEDALSKAFNKRAEDIELDMEPPDYLGELVEQYQEESWDNKDDDDKFNWTKNNTSIIDALQEEYDAYVKNGGEGGESTIVKLPVQFDPLQEGGSDQDYRRTQAVASFLSLQRQHQLMVARGIAEDPDKAAIKRVDSSLWNQWKGSSTSEGGMILQLAAAEELGGRYREISGYSQTEIRKIANNEYGKIGGYDGVKALVRAKWEVSQFLLDKADKQVVDVYRGYKMDLPSDTKIEKIEAGAEFQKRDFERLPDVGLERNGAFSTTSERSVANNWGGGRGNTKLVVRIEAPRTSVLSLPAFGINVHSEKELVVVGTAWRGWDVWRGNAPSNDEVPLKKAA